MGVKTGCLIYCAVTAAVGAYFFFIVSVMEYRQNQSMKYFWNISKDSIHEKLVDYNKANGTEYTSLTDNQMDDLGFVIDMSAKG